MAGIGPGESGGPGDEPHEEEWEKDEGLKSLLRVSQKPATERREPEGHAQWSEGRTCHRPVRKVDVCAHVREADPQPVLMPQILAHSCAVEMAYACRRSEGESALLGERKREDRVLAGKNMLNEPVRLVERAAANGEVARYGVKEWGLRRWKPVREFEQVAGSSDAASRGTVHDGAGHGVDTGRESTLEFVEPVGVRDCVRVQEREQLSFGSRGAEIPRPPGQGFLGEHEPSHPAPPTLELTGRELARALDDDDLSVAPLDLRLQGLENGGQRRPRAPGRKDYRRVRRVYTLQPGNSLPVSSRRRFASFCSSRVSLSRRAPLIAGRSIRRAKGYGSSHWI